MRPCNGSDDAVLARLPTHPSAGSPTCPRTPSALAATTFFHSPHLPSLGRLRLPLRLRATRRHFPQQLLPSLPTSENLLLRALADSWLDPAWRHSEERQHTITMGLVLRALLEHPSLQQQHREAVGAWQGCGQRIAERDPRVS